jgi:iron complex outermembrane receptor protein
VPAGHRPSRCSFVRYLLLVFLVASATVAADVDDIHALAVNPGPLADALLDLAAQAEVSVVFSPAAVAGLRAAGVRGTMSARAALPTLIGAACLAVVEITPNLIALRARCPNGVELPATEPPRLTAAAEPAPGGMEEIIVRERYVTGSRIRLPGTETMAHIDILDRQAIALAGNQDIGALLRSLPAVAGNATSTLVTNGGDGTANITLRGLPASNTLVLLNGRRLNTEPWSGRSVDLNTIPLGLVERIEVLKEGASALYGSDAIAGVVNVVTRDDLNGLQASTYYGSSSRNDLDTTNSSLAYGGQVGALGYALGATFYEQDPIFSRDRSLSASSDDRGRGGSDKRSSATSPAWFTFDGAARILADGSRNGSDPTDFRLATSDDLYEYRRFTTAVVPSRRYSLFGHARHPAPLGELYLEALFTDTNSDNTLAPTPLFTAFEMLDLTVAADAAYNPFDAPIGDVRRRFSELGARAQRNRSTTRRAVIGWEGSTGDTHWDASIGHHVTTAREQLDGSLRATRVAQALGPASDCTAPCEPLDLFGPPGSITPAMLDYLAVDTTRRGRSTLDQLNVGVDFPLTVATTTVEVASGMEWRRESLRVRPDALLAAGDTIGGAADSRFAGARDIWEAYAEAWIPLLRDHHLAHRLDAQIAARWSRYSDFGATTNPRVALHYRPISSLLLRASATRGFRAPTLRQLHAATSQTFEFLNDPCALATNVGRLPGCVVQSDPTLVQFMTLRAGDRNLDPERAQTYTIGAVVTPRRAPGLRLSLDYYHILDRDVVDANAQLLIDGNARSLYYAGQVIRDGSGNIVRVLAPFQNVGRRRVRGLDVAADYTRPAGPASSLSLSLKASHISTFEEEFDPGSEIIDYAGTFRDEASAGNGALPSWKVNVSAVWQSQFWNVGYHIRYISALDEVVPVVERRRSIDAWHVDRVQATYLGPPTLWTRVTVGIDNLWDAQPPFSAAAFNDSYDSRTYDITGRFLYVHLQKDL